MPMEVKTKQLVNYIAFSENSASAIIYVHPKSAQ